MAVVGVNRLMGYISIPDYLEPGPYELLIYASHGNRTEVMLLHIIVKDGEGDDPQGEPGDDDMGAGDGRKVLWIVVGLVILFILQAVLIALFRRRKSRDKNDAMEKFDSSEVSTWPKDSGTVQKNRIVRNVQPNIPPTIYRRVINKNAVPFRTARAVPYIENGANLPQLGTEKTALPSSETLVGPRAGIKALPQWAPGTVEPGTYMQGSNSEIQPSVPQPSEQERSVNEEVNIPSIMSAHDDLGESLPAYETSADIVNEVNDEDTSGIIDEDDEIEIGWEEDEKGSGERDFDVEIERLGEVSFDEPLIEDDIQTDETEMDESATALASIPVKKVAISKETGEELKHCPKCDGYFERGEDDCPHCAEKEGMNGLGKVAGMWGLDPTDREESEDETEPPRRYPEEMIFDDDDVKLEDLLEGI